MPIYEYYCPDNHTVYQFYAKTLAQGQTIPKCPDNPAFRMQRTISAFAITKGGRSDEPPPVTDGGGDDAEDPRLDAAMEAMESEFANIDENDPKAMGRMMRRMAELTGESLDGEMEEVVRKLEEGADPDALEEQLGRVGEGGDGDEFGGGGMGGEAEAEKPAREPRPRFRVKRTAPRRDPNLYDFE